MTVNSLRSAAGLALSVFLAGLPATARADIEPNAGMMRYPDVGRTQIAFIYAGDIWLVPRAGGVATRLASPPGQELFPRFSPDDKTIAFIGNYEGNRDIYTIPVDGGVASRVTYHPSGETLCDWTPDGQRMVYTTSGLGGLRRQTQLMSIPATGGMIEQLPVPYGANGAVSPDGTWLAYTPHSIDNRTWKRYRGGMATDIWLFNLKDKTSRKITDWEGTDSLPMWHGDKVYYLSDQGTGPDGYGGEHRLNIWEFTPATGARRQVTQFKDFDVKWPSMGPGPNGGGEIVFQNGSSLYLLDLSNAAAQPKAVSVTIPGDRPTIRDRQVDVERLISGWSVSPSAKRVAVEARGDIWSLPAEKGTPRNLTRTSGVAERDPSWSPDGRWIAFFSDATGEYELYLMQSDGLGKTTQLTNKDSGPQRFRYNPVWSPDSTKLLFSDKSGVCSMYTLGEADGQGGFKPGTTVVVDTDPWGNPFTPTWSHDGKWLAYTMQEPRSGQNAIWLYNVGSGQKTKVTSGMFDDGSPVFDRKGDYLFFATRRNFTPTYSDLDTTFIYTGTQVLAAIPLRADLVSPWAPKSDEEDWTKKADKKDEKKDGAGEKKGGDKGDPGKAGTPDAKDDGVSGTWDGTATGPDPLPPDGLPFSLSLKLEGGKLTGTFTSALHTGPIQDGAYDASTKTVTFSLNANDAVVMFTLKIEGGALSGSANVNNVIYPMTAKRAGPGGDVKPAEKDDKKDDKKEEKKKDVVIDLQGMEARAVQLPVPSGRFGRLAVNDKNQLMYVRFPAGGAEEAGIKLFDLTDEKKEEKSVSAGAGFELTADGKKMLVARGSSASIQDAAAGATGKPVVTAGMVATISPREEWKQIFNDAWRIERDFFYVDNMHGVDWNGLRERYGKMLDDCASRDDLSFVISELISELNIGHAYYSGGDIESGPNVSVGLLGCDYELVPAANGAPAAYRITRIYRGAPWDTDAKGPLSQPGVNVKEGDFLLAVNGVPVDTKKDPWAAFQGLAGKVITITVNDTPTLERPTAAARPEAEAKQGDSKPDGEKKEEAKPKTTGLRDVVVQTLGSEDNLRYREWIERKRAYVDQKTGGKVGYIYVPNTGQDGQNDLFRQFYGQMGKEAIIIDERWNGGGQIPTRFIELLNRPITNYWARREGPVNPWPPDAHQGPKCMLINGLAGSGGDMFPWLFRYNSLGKLIGTRTWGGLVGISGNPGLIDGGSVTAPTFGFFKKDGTWGVEGHGVDPDIVVIDDPALMQNGGDPQLDVAITHMLEQIQTNPYRPPSRPKNPERSGMGIPPSDR